MSPNKREELLNSLTRRDAQKPPMEVTYENKGIVLDQMLSDKGSKDAKQQNSKNAETQTFADTKEQTSKTAEQLNSASAKEQISASTEQQFIADANNQNNTGANEQVFADAKQQNSKEAKEQNNKNLRRITFHIPPELFTELKIIAAREDLTMLEIGAQMAAEFVERKKAGK